MIFLPVGTNLQAEMVKYVDENGKIHYVDTDYGKVPDRYKHQIKAKEIKTEEVKEEAKPEEASATPVPALTNPQAVTAPSTVKAKSVEMFVNSDCPKCLLVQSALNNSNVVYTTYNIETDPEARKRYESLNTSVLPVLIIGGSQVMTEFDVNKFFTAIRSGSSSTDSSESLTNPFESYIKKHKKN